MKTKVAEVCGILRQGANTYYMIRKVSGEDKYLAIPYIEGWIESRGYYPPPVFVTFHGPYLFEEFSTGCDEDGVIKLVYMPRSDGTYPKEVE